MVMHNYKGRNNIGCRMYVVYEPPDDGFYINRNICRGLLIHNKSKSEVHFVGVL